LVFLQYVVIFKFKNEKSSTGNLIWITCTTLFDIHFIFEIKKGGLTDDR